MNPSGTQKSTARRTGYAVIGCGGRISALTALLELSPRVKLVGGWDPSVKNTRRLLKLARCPRARIYGSMEDLLADAEVEWVLIGSPNTFHTEQILAAFAAGKHVFSEKPLAITTGECVRIIEAHRKSGVQLATGFTLRYASIYRKAKAVIDSGRLGRLVSVTASENIRPRHATYIFTNWRRRKELAGSHILEKCVHDLDILNWFTGSLPKRVAAIGGNLMFIPENAPLAEKYPKQFRSPGWDNLPEAWEKGGTNPFLEDIGIEDHISALIEYKNGVKATLQATVANAIPERRIYVNGTEGNLILELYSGILKWKNLGMRFIRRRRFIGGGHGDGDIHIVRRLARSMADGTEPECGGAEGLYSTAVAAGIDEARISGSIVEMGPTWKKIGS